MTEWKTEHCAKQIDDNLCDGIIGERCFDCDDRVVTWAEAEAKLDEQATKHITAMTYLEAKLAAAEKAILSTAPEDALIIQHQADRIASLEAVIKEKDEVIAHLDRQVANLVAELDKRRLKG